MSIPGSASPLLLASTAAAPTGFQVSRSLRFNAADSAYLSRTPAVAGNRRTWTWAGWVKRSKFTSRQFLIIGNVVTNANYWEFDASDRLHVSGNDGTSSDWEFYTTQVFRDPSSWYHFVITFNSTEATTGDRVKIYVNGSRITNFDSSSYPSLNYETFFNQAVEHDIGSAGVAGLYFNGYLANIHFIDGQALTPSSFTETDATTGQLIPKTYTGSYGTNGFNLLFADNSSNTASTLGKDSSGLGNNWTPNNLSINAGGPTSVSAASGALPIFNTTDTYGAVKGTGTRTDTNASSLSLCVPMGTSTGLSLTDEQPTGRVSSSATLVNTGVTNNTSFSQFYGGSAYFDGTTSQLKTTATSDFLFGTGDFTVEGWFYQASATTYPSVLEIGNHGAGPTGIIFGTSYAGNAYVYSAGFYGAAATSLNVWNHIAWTRASGVLKIFVNGFLLSSVAFTNNLTDSTNGVTIGTTHTLIPGYYFPGYMQDLRIYKGVAKYTGNFNPPTPTVNATVAAGNDSLVDSPTNYGTDTYVGGEVRGNYATLNPLDKNSNLTLSNGNLDCVATSGAWKPGKATIGVTGQGKYYWEILIGPALAIIGIATQATPNADDRVPGDDATSYGYVLSGNKINNNSQTAYGSSFTTGDIIGTAYDAGSGKVWFSKNGTWQSSGDPANGTNAAFTGISTSLTYLPMFALSGAGTSSFNAGQRAFAYTAPSGFKALCTQNLPAPLVTKSNTVMDVVTYTGTGSSLTLPNGSSTPTSIAFTPDFAWLKGRSGATNHALYDAVRGVQKDLVSNSDSAETTETTGLTAFGTNTFTVGSLAKLNTSSATYVAWAWNAGGSTVSNTAGSITSQVRSNPTAGFSVVTWTGTGSAGTVGHGLGAQPQFIIVKSRDASADPNWFVSHIGIGLGVGRLVLNLAAANDNGAAALLWNSTAPTSTLLPIGAYAGVNQSTLRYVAYCFAPVVGFSSFGSYVGNGSSDGPMVYTGFRPRWILVKCTSSSNDWLLTDSSRLGYNIRNELIWANLSAAEYQIEHLDILSNGFKFRTTNAGWNGSAATYIYAAFAEAPFNYSRAR